MRKALLVGLLLVPAFGLVPATATATAPNDEAAVYEYELEAPNTAMASDGQTIAVTGMGSFRVHPNRSLAGGGSFTHTIPGSGSITGTWTALDLLSFQPYGC